MRLRSWGDEHLGQDTSLMGREALDAIGSPSVTTVILPSGEVADLRRVGSMSIDSRV